MKKTSVIFILPDLETGGAERIITTLVNHLPRNNFIPKIMLMRRQGGYLDFLKEDVEIIDLKVQRIRNSILPIFREIRTRKPNIVFCGFGEVNAYISPFIKWFPKTKFIARETNVVSQHVTRREIKFFYKFYNNYDKIVCQSDDMLNDLVDNFNVRKSKLVKINNPVDFDLIHKMLVGEKVKNFAEGFKNVVAIGNLSYRKGFDNLLKVFYYLKDQPIRLHIIGDGKDSKILQDMKLELGLENVFFYGKQKNPFRFLKFANLFILSSRYEGFPNALLEAGASGVYSLVNNCLGGINEIIQIGINGEISNIENHKTFAMKILEVLEKPHNNEKIISSIYSRFSKEIIMGKYEKLLSEI